MESLSILNFVIVAIVESIFSVRWHPGYFQVGIPIYCKTYPFNGTADTPIGETALNEAFKKRFTVSFVFKEIAPNIFAFREKLFELNLITYTPVMHGRLTVNQGAREIRVVGLLNWWILAFVLTVLIAFSKDMGPTLLLVLLLGVIYLFQKGKYDKVGHFAYEWNSRDWSSER
ncbi:MAG: hypothetical protein SWE60_01395 [Thermodesulfobacteriota bacterium]|nr:hypothetical protein [Thermodesulfobacteriota bacterium]